MHSRILQAQPSRLTSLPAGDVSCARPRAVSGASTFCKTVSQGNNAKLWKTIPTLQFPPIGRPCQRTLPRVGRVSPDKMCRSVDFPEPDGPRRAQIVFDSMVRANGAITWISLPSGCSKVFSICCASMMVSRSTGLFSGRPGVISVFSAGAEPSAAESSSMSLCHASSGSSSKNRMRSSESSLSTSILISSRFRVWSNTYWS